MVNHTLLKSSRRRAIAGTNADLLWIGPLAMKFNENLIKIRRFFFSGIWIWKSLLQNGGLSVSEPIVVVTSGLSKVQCEKDINIGNTWLGWWHRKGEPGHLREHVLWGTSFPIIEEMKIIHYSDVIMNAMAIQINSVSIVCSTAYSGADIWSHPSMVKTSNYTVAQHWLGGKPLWKTVMTYTCDFQSTCQM